MRLIDADELKDFFFSETSGTDEIIRDLIDKHNLTYLNYVNEDEVMDFAKDLLRSVKNVIDTQPTAYDIDKVVEALENNRLEVQKFKNDCIALSDHEVCDIENAVYNRTIEIVKVGGKNE